jgi:predicted transcriptional regulator
MTKTKQALAWIALGRPRSTMGADLGLTPMECKQLIGYLMKFGYIRSIPVPTYELTERGQERAAYVPTSSAQARAHQRMLRRMDKPESTDKMVAKARRSQPNSVFNLGAQL